MAYDGDPITSASLAPCGKAARPVAPRKTMPIQTPRHVRAADRFRVSIVARKRAILPIYGVSGVSSILALWGSGWTFLDPAY